MSELFECGPYRGKITEKTCIPRLVKAKLLEKNGQNNPSFLEVKECAGCPKGLERIIGLLGIEAPKKRGRPKTDDTVVNVKVDLTRFPKVQSSLEKLAGEMKMAPGKLLAELVTTEIQNIEGKGEEVVIEKDSD